MSLVYAIAEKGADLIKADLNATGQAFPGAAGRMVMSKMVGMVVGFARVFLLM